MKQNIVYLMASLGLIEEVNPLCWRSENKGIKMLCTFSDMVDASTVDLLFFFLCKKEGFTEG